MPEAKFTIAMETLQFSEKMGKLRCRDQEDAVLKTLEIRRD